MSEEINENFPDRFMPAMLAYQVLETLKQSDDAAYRVYLILSTRFGAGQRIMS